MGLNINFLNGQGLNTLLSLLYNRISGKADTPNANNMASASAAGYMSAVDFNKINAQAISANTDLNNITNDGWYCCTSDAIAATLSNCPTTVAFYLEVHKHTAAGKYQYIVEYSPTGAKHYSRNFFGSWGNWNEWKLTDTTYSNATTSTAGLMSAADKEKLNNVNAGQMVYLSESTAKILTDSPRSLSESLLNYKIIEVRYLQLEETISGTTYQTWGWARLIKNSSGDFMSAPAIHFISNGSSLTIKAYEIGILSANPTQLALTRDTSGAGLWTGTIIGYK